MTTAKRNNNDNAWDYAI